MLCHPTLHHPSLSWVQIGCTENQILAATSFPAFQKYCKRFHRSLRPCQDREWPQNHIQCVNYPIICAKWPIATSPSTTSSNLTATPTIHRWGFTVGDHRPKVVSEIKHSPLLSWRPDGSPLSSGNIQRWLPCRTIERAPPTVDDHRTVISQRQTETATSKSLFSQHENIIGLHHLSPEAHQPGAPHRNHPQHRHKSRLDPGAAWDRWEWNKASMLSLLCLFF